MTFADDPLEVVASEKPTGILPLKDPLTGEEWPYTMKQDCIAKYEGFGCVVERKTTGFTHAQFFKKFDFNHTITGYVWGAQQLYPELKINAVLLEVGGKPRSKSGEAWHHRELYVRTQADIQHWIDVTCSRYRRRKLMQEGQLVWETNTARCENWAGFPMTCQFKPLCTHSGNQTTLIEHAYKPKNWAEDDHLEQEIERRAQEKGLECHIPTHQRPTKVLSDL